VEDFSVQRKLLIVDDEEEIRDYLKDFFEYRDYSVLTAATKEEAMKALEDEKPLAALLDIRMRSSRDGIDPLQWKEAINKRLQEFGRHRMPH
jgi:DNA-binding response OmpR family regulator